MSEESHESIAIKIEVVLQKFGNAEDPAADIRLDDDYVRRNVGSRGADIDGDRLSVRR